MVKLEREIRQLEIEKQALVAEKLKKNDKRVHEIDKQLADAKEVFTAQHTQRESDRALVLRVKEFKEKIQQLTHDADIAEKQTDYTKAANIRYNQIPKIEQELTEAEDHINQDDHRGNNDTVTEDDIAKIISKRTSIPVQKLISSEKEKLTELEAHLGKRVIGQEKATELVARAIRRAKA